MPPVDDTENMVQKLPDAVQQTSIPGTHKADLHIWSMKKKSDSYKNYKIHTMTLLRFRCHLREANILMELENNWLVDYITLKFSLNF